MNKWQDEDHVAVYLSRASRLPRAEGERILLDELPATVSRVLDLGSGDGRLLGLVLDAHPQARGVALDFSPPMLALLGERFGSSESVEVVAHDMGRPLGDLGTFDAVISSFAIHHLEHERKRELYSEVRRLLRPGAVFANLEHVSSPSERAHERFLRALGLSAEADDPSNRLLDVETQLTWLRELGLADVDCYWKWREFALLVGRAPR